MPTQFTHFKGLYFSKDGGSLMDRSKSKGGGCWWGEERQMVQVGRTTVKPSEAKRWGPAQGRQVQGALLHCWLRCCPWWPAALLTRRNNVLGNCTHDPPGILSYTNTIPILTNYLRVIPTRETCRAAYMSSFIPLEGQTGAGFKLRKKFHS